MTVLETARLILRPPERGDLEPFMAFYTGPRAATIGGAMAPHEAWRRFSSLIGHWTLRGFGRFIALERATGAPIGHVGPNHPPSHPEREIAWSLWTDAAEGRGLAHEAAAAARNHAFETLRWPTAVSYIEPGNTRSRRLADRLGAVVDADAPQPATFSCLVYRHPTPGALA